MATFEGEIFYAKKRLLAHNCTTKIHFVKELAVFRHFFLMVEQPHSSVMAKFPEMKLLLKSFHMTRASWNLLNHVEPI